jgi:hypothetical protein
MYKPNGEERMTEQEARLRREMIIARRLERGHAESLVAEALGTTVFSVLLRSEPREELLEAGFSQLR